MKRIIEVCAGSYQDCLAAYRGGAQRAELNSALSVGGLTPSVAALRPGQTGDQPEDHLHGASARRGLLL